MTRRYYLNKGRIVAAIDNSHSSQADFAEEIGLSRSHDLVPLSLCRYHQ